MHILSTENTFISRFDVGLAATIGFFDGVHTGHRFVLERLQQVASENGLESAVVVFEEHPQQILRGIHVPLLTTLNERIALLKNSGVDHVLPFRFEEIRLLSAEAFMHLLHEKYDVCVLIMGYDHRFGSDQLMDFSDYEQCAARVGIKLVLLPQNPRSDASSTTIRKALASGNIEKANQLLGYTYTLAGKVVPGKQIGRTIGFPTANLSVPEEKLIPLAGVYVCKVDEMDALLNIGNNPTTQGTEVTIELHLIDFDGDLYGKNLSVKLLRYLRPEQKFDNIEALRQQIMQDVRAINNTK